MLSRDNTRLLAFREMASIYHVARVLNAIADEFENECLKCMEENADVVEMCVREQLYCGLDGAGKHLSPTYDDDPYFSEEGRWKGRAKEYKKMKSKLTPPMRSVELNLAARPESVPNLFITGVFYDSIYAKMNGGKMDIYTRGFRDGPLIEHKYGSAIFVPGGESMEYFNVNFLMPWLEEFIKGCGYK